MTTMIVVLLLVVAGIVWLYIHDVTQTQHTILRNYPVLGHFRYFSESVGEYMRQYQYLPDWIERPFTRLERSWIYRSAKGVSNLVSFGSENSPAFVFRNAPFPILDEEKTGYPGFLDDWFSHCAAHPEGCPDYVQIDGGEGGTGAAPAPLADYVGLPITQALPMVAEARDRHGLHDRIRIIASGKLITPDKVAWALCMGADFVSSARGFMFSLGCIQAMKCGSGKCPTGVTAVDPKLIAGLDPADKAVRVKRYAERVREEVEIIAHSCGLTNPSEFRAQHVTSIERGVGGFRNAAE